MLEWILLVVLVALILLMAVHYEWDNGTFFFMLAVVIIPWSIYHWRDTPEEHDAKMKAYIEEQEEKKRPVKITEADGCSVYQFYAEGRNHFFTKCNDKVTTESSYTSGKTTKTETIVTETK